MSMTAMTAAFTKANTELNAHALHLLPQEVAKFHAEVVLRLLNGVVYKTPVATGRLRNGWQVRVDMIPVGQIETEPGGAEEVIQRGREALAKLTPYAVVYLHNNVEYFSYIEDGHSMQAPGGMVSLTLDEIRQHYIS